MKNILKNFTYQMIFQLTKILLPIITIPIVSKALGPQGIGVYNYTFANIQYFVLFAGLGISLFGTREIASAANYHERNVTFSNLFIMKIITSIISLIIFLIFLSISNYKFFYFLQSLSILAVLFDVSWYYMGIENFKKTSLVQTLVQIISFFLIVVLIKNYDDLTLYIVIQSGSLLVSQLIIFLTTKNYFNFKFVEKKRVIRYFKNSFHYFIPSVAVSIYSILNKTILGVFDGPTSVGFFTNSMQLNTVFITLISTMDTVLLPKMSKMFSDSKDQEMVKMLKTVIGIQTSISIPIMFGICAIQEQLIPWFFGNEFLTIRNYVPFLSIIIVISPIGISIARQFLLPRGEINKYNKSVFLGAIISVVLNCILIPFLHVYGAIIATIISEMFVTLSRYIDFKRTSDVNLLGKNTVFATISGIIMFYIITNFTKKLALTSSMSTTIIQVGIGVLVYAITFVTLEILNKKIDSLKKK